MPKFLASINADNSTSYWDQAPIVIPHQIPQQLTTTKIVLRGLKNPRGLRVQEDGSLLLVEAGSGTQDAQFSGRLLRVVRDTEGAYLAPQTVVGGFRSMNMQARMCRDEIFGLADVAFGAGRCLLSQTDYTEGSRIYEIVDGCAHPIIFSHGNLNSLCYHPKRGSWLTVKPDANQVVEFPNCQSERIVASLPSLPAGQQCVPVCVTYQANAAAIGDILVSLFTGELARNPAKAGIEFFAKSGRVLRINMATGQVSTLIDGLTLPTGIAFSPSGNLLILELCAEFLQPMPRDTVPDFPWHGGFKRYSGRLLEVNLDTGAIRVLANELDTPSNLCVHGNTVLLSEGMGLPGRKISDAGGHCLPLEGFVRQLQLPINPV